jgi:DNA-binding GntR family transcriptional regulator
MTGTGRATPDGSETLATKVGVWLAEQILAGELRPGQWVSENELAARFGVSRSPVREVLRLFGQEGIVEAHPRRGTKICEPSAEDLDGLYRARQLVDGEMSRLAISHATDDDVERLADIVRELQTGEHDVPAYYWAKSDIWHLLMEMCPNRTISDLAAVLWRRSLWFRGIVLAIDGSQCDAVGFFEQLVELARHRDGNGAGQATSEFIMRLRETLLDRLFIQVRDGRTISRFAR